MPITLCYHIGYNCNLDCDYCLSKNNDVRHSAINLVKHIQYMSAWRPLRVVISGGEPLMYVDELSKILQCLREKGINSFISTNGTLIEKEYFKLQGLPDWYDIIKSEGKMVFPKSLKELTF